MKKQILTLLMIFVLFSLQAQNPNKFIGNVTFQITGAENVDLKVATKEWQTAMSIKVKKGDEVRMIFDHKKENVTILTDAGPNGKMGIVSKMNNIQDLINEKEKDYDINIEKTNEKKDILGYTCTKYIITTEDGVVVSWVTDKIHFNPFESISKIGNQSKSAMSKSHVKNLEGMSLHSIFTDKNNKVTEIKVTSIDNNAPSEALFDTSGYQMMDMSMFGK